MSLEGKYFAFLNIDQDELKAYILSSEVFWPLYPGGERLSIGALLLTKLVLQNSLSKTVDLARYFNLVELIKETRSEWKNNWGDKAAQEWQVRIKLWEKSLNEFRKETNDLVFLKNEIEQRVFLELLKGELLQQNEFELQRLSVCDSLLKTLTKPGEFVWESKFSSIFPKTVFWFLYLQSKKG